MGHAVHGDGAFFHDLQQRRLGTARGTVDLITQKQVAHYAAGVVYQPPGLLLEHGKAHNVRGQHVRGKLHAALVQLQRAGKGQRQRRFAHTGDVLDQHVAARQHGHPDGADGLRLAKHGFGNFRRYVSGLLVVLHGHSSRCFCQIASTPTQAAIKTNPAQRALFSSQIIRLETALPSDSVLPSCGSGVML